MPVLILVNTKITFQDFFTSSDSTTQHLSVDMTVFNKSGLASTFISDKIDEEDFVKRYPLVTGITFYFGRNQSNLFFIDEDIVSYWEKFWEITDQLRIKLESLNKKITILITADYINKINVYRNEENLICRRKTFPPLSSKNLSALEKKQDEYLHTFCPYIAVNRFNKEESVDQSYVRRGNNVKLEMNVIRRTVEYSYWFRNGLSIIYSIILLLLLKILIDLTFKYIVPSAWTWFVIMVNVVVLGLTGAILGVKIYKKPLETGVPILKEKQEKTEDYVLHKCYKPFGKCIFCPVSRYFYHAKNRNNPLLNV